MKKCIAVSLLVFLSVIQTSYAATQQLKLTITDVPTFFPGTTQIYFSPGASTAFVPVQDNLVIFNVDTAYPQIYSMSSDNVGCSSNGYGDFTTCTEIRLGYRVEGGSTYRIAASQIQNFDPASMIVLEDRLLGLSQNLLVGPYDFQATQFEQSENRFFLHISYPPSITSTASGCDNNDGEITVDQQTCFSWDSCALQNSLGQQLTMLYNVTGVFSFTGLAEGMYTVHFRYHNIYTVAKYITVDGHQIQSSITAPTLNGVTGEVMDFSAVSSHTDSFYWDFGDGSLINGVANPEYTFLEAGTYTVTVVCTNIYGCSDTATITVVIAQGTSVMETQDDAVFISCCSKNLSINFSKPTSANQFELYNLEGKKLLTNPIVSSNTNVALNNLSAGVYIVAIKGAQSYFSRKIVLTE